MAVVLGRKPGGSGGGSAAVAPIVRGPFSFAFDDAGLEDGLEFYTPTVNDLMFDAWVELDTLFDGTTPKFDFGPGGEGLFNLSSSPLTLGGGGSAVDSGTDFLTRGIPGGGSFNNSLMVAAANYSAGTPNNRTTWGRFLTTTPLEVWVSQDGTKGGAAVGGTTGAARLYIVTATPVAF